MAKEELILLHIEEQAVVQVIIRDVAKYLDIQDNSKINAVRLLIMYTEYCRSMLVCTIVSRANAHYRVGPHVPFN